MTTSGASLGEMLVEARRSAGLTAADISARTHIMQSTIYALEEDKIDTLRMSSGYIRGYILSYCKICGVDPSPYIAQFTLLEQQSGQTQVKRSPRKSNEKALEPLNRKAEQELNWKVIIITAVVIAAVALGVFLFNSDDNTFMGLNPLPAQVPPTITATAIEAVPVDLRVPFTFSIEALPGHASHVRVVIDGTLALDQVLTSTVGDNEDDSGETFHGVLEAEIEIADPESIIIMQDENEIPIPEDGILFLTATEE